MELDISNIGKDACSWEGNKPQLESKDVYVSAYRVTRIPNMSVGSLSMCRHVSPTTLSRILHPDVFFTSSETPHHKAAWSTAASANPTAWDKYLLYRRHLIGARTGVTIHNLIIPRPTLHLYIDSRHLTLFDPQANNPTSSYKSTPASNVSTSYCIPNNRTDQQGMILRLSFLWYSLTRHSQGYKTWPLGLHIIFSNMRSVSFLQLICAIL